MNCIVLYSSRTSNTKKVAEAVCQGLPAGTACVDVKEVPADLSAYDYIFVGFWVDKGNANAEAQEILKNLPACKAGIFATLGADPKSEHAAQALANGAALVPEGVTVVDSFICQGAVDPKLIEMMYKMFPAGSAHGKSPERDALHAEAAKHPDAADLAAAKAFAAGVLSKGQEA